VIEIDLGNCVFGLEIALATEDTHVTLSVHLPCMLYVLSNPNIMKKSQSIIICHVFEDRLRTSKGFDALAEWNDRGKKLVSINGRHQRQQFPNFLILARSDGRRSRLKGEDCA